MKMKHIQHWVFVLGALGAINLAHGQGIKAPAGGKLSPSLGSSNGSDVATIDSIVAIVNNDIITRSELNRQVALIERQMSRRAGQLPERNELRKQVLERMVLDRAQLQRAEEVGIRVDDTQIESAMTRVAEQNKLSLGEFLERLKDEGVSPERFREEVRTEITIGRLREREVEARIQISDAEIQNYLASRAPDATAINKPEVNWIQLLVRIPGSAEGATLKQAENKAQDLEASLRNGSNVAALVQANPELAIDGTGQMGWSGYDEVPSLFSEFLSKAQPNSVEPFAAPTAFTC